MYSIKLMNKIAQIGLNELGPDFGIVENQDADAIILRSADMHDYAFESTLLGVARAGAGVNNIPIDRCSEAGIAVFNTPGANANAVKELAVCALLLASRDIIDGANWAQSLDPADDVAKLVEKGKKNFAGYEIAGKTLGVLGLGAVGGMVANAACDLGMEVLGCDPYMSVKAAWGLARRVKQAANYDEIYEKADYITIHVPLTPDTKGMINEETLAKCKDGVRIINLARGGLVDNDAIKAALASGKVARYVTDFPDAEVLGVEHLIALPHLGASTEESEDNCAVMAAREISAFLEDGIIRNSVNLPDFTEPRGDYHRVTVINRNTPNILGQITALMAGEGVNIEHLFNRSKKDYAYTVIDSHDALTAEALAHLRAIEGVIRVRTIG